MAERQVWWESRCWYQKGARTILDNTRIQTCTTHVPPHLAAGAAAGRNTKKWQMRNASRCPWGQTVLLQGKAVASGDIEESPVPPRRQYKGSLSPAHPAGSFASSLHGRSLQLFVLRRSGTNT